MAARKYPWRNTTRHRWYKGNSNATVEELDPQTGDLTEYETKSKDAHAAVFHSNGHLYFIAQHASEPGRFNPETVELKQADTQSKPYGIKVNQDGTLSVTYNGTNKLGAMNPETMEVRYFDLLAQRPEIPSYALAVIGDIVCYNESGMRPDARVRLDQETESFQS